MAERMMDLQEELLSLRISDWNDKVFSWQWAFLALMLILPWIIWWKIVDRRRIAEIFSLGLLVSLISSLLNGNGLNLLLWSYPYKLLPFSPRAYSFSLSVIPVTFMLLYQYLPKLRSFVVGTALIAGTTAFIVQPLLSLAGIYKLMKWNYFYSFLVLLSMGIGSWFVHHLILYRSFKLRETERLTNESSNITPAFKKLRKRQPDNNGS